VAIPELAKLRQKKSVEASASKPPNFNPPKEITHLKSVVLALSEKLKLSLL
jgi:hypothetical protein